MDFFDYRFGGMLFSMLMVAMPFGLLALGIAYAVLKIRDARAEEHDPEIGLKSSLYFVFSVSVLLILFGLTILVVDALMDSSRSSRQQPDFPRQQQPAPAKKDFNQEQRTGAAFMVAGFAMAVFHLVLIFGFTNDRRYPDVKRVFVGMRFSICGVVVLATFTSLVWMVFQENVTFDAFKPFLGVLLVWAPAWLVHLVLMRVYGHPAPVTRARASGSPFGD